MGRRAHTLQELWERAEEALESSSKRAEALLVELASKAEDGSEPALFAHRHLAELNLEQNPWKAALHLRRVLTHCGDDDGLHALLGLCHALLGNYRVAVRSYRRAAQLSPQTPWYHHNLGHLVDVALGSPAEAEPHLRRAFDLEPDHDEIIGSLAHSVARQGKLEEALRLAKLAQEKGPYNADHKALLHWIEEGALETPGTIKKVCGWLQSDLVTETVDTKMSEAGFSTDEIQRAKQLWSDVQDRCELRVVKPEVLAAALEYAIAIIEKRPGSTQAEIARRYGVAARSVSTRYMQIRNALALQPGDPRYAASR